MNRKTICIFLISLIIFSSFLLKYTTHKNTNELNLNKSTSFITFIKTADRLQEFKYDEITMFFKNSFSAKTPEGLDTKEYNWYFKHIANGTPPGPPDETRNFLSKYDSFYLGDTSKKVIYLTFDEGYENGYTSQILDVLKKHNIKAAFFVVKPYITSNPDIIRRMVDEGHLVCNHSARHPSMASLKNQEKFNKELTDVEEAFEKVTGQKMPKYFRPPMGKYSELSLYYTKSLGYKTIFWSFAYADWDPNNQPSREFARKRILERTHNGAIILLHAVSKTNADILDSVIAEWKAQGYEIRSLDELVK
ncbi:delta-lactam-biosynthetic de-N-acetylase [Fonticella tunisiensis]|uniref:Peptidoglycan-N-acetylmuramic acid deacetylase n=1 Tax=Fonticella tunisiensis TaxID=1096341 RepID=A0A4R7KQW8_9CLOT|nr:delta-lactam-biosynthetic de-N-acetylase [Fonticella tunisiensis]TDT61116.1 peptidoglycan-N-acetylmuramic acid deacetylase [Fonticella tunisiensis]